MHTGVAMTGFTQQKIDQLSESEAKELAKGLIAILASSTFYGEKLLVRASARADMLETAPPHSQARETASLVNGAIEFLSNLHQEYLRGVSEHV